MKDKLKELIKNSYAPYSGIHFACIVESKNGKFYSGVNVENASYGATICAERNAINSAISDGETSFSALYLMTDKEEICYPCNICKQTFLEFFDKNVLFSIMNTKGETQIYSFDNIMSKNFTKENLK